MNKTNICVFTATYPMNGSNGGVFIQDQCKMLIEQGFTVTVLYALATKELNSLLNISINKVTRIFQEGINVYIYPSFQFAATYTVPLLRRSIEYSCERLYEEYLKFNKKPDLLIGHFSYPAGIGAIKVSKENSIPLIMVEHLSLFLRPKARPWLNGSLRKVVEQADRFICVSSGLADGIRKRLKPNKRMIVIPNTIDDIFVYHIIPHKNIYQFLSVGNLVEIKNFSLLIDAFSTAFRKNDKVQLSIAGDGPLREKLEKQIKENNMEGQIHLLGLLSRENLCKEYVNCDSFVLLSKNETFGVAYREAMAVGRPVISSNNIGIHNGWENAFGVILNSFNENDVVEALIGMHQSKQYDNEYIARKMHEMYSFDSIGRQYKKLIDDLLK